MCHKCPKLKGFKEKFHLDRHDKMLHNETLYRFTCEFPKKDDENTELCNKKFKSRASLKLHEKRHLKDNFARCIKCKKIFKITEKNNQCTNCSPQVFQCAKCDKTFITNAELKRHNVSHDNVRDFICECIIGNDVQCMKAFKTQAALSYHMKTHSEKKEFECKTCNKLYKTKRHLSRHEKSMHSEKSFECDYTDGEGKKCKKLFPSQDQLAAHKKSTQQKSLTSVPSVINNSKWIMI